MWRMFYCSTVEKCTNTFCVAYNENVRGLIGYTGIPGSLVTPPANLETTSLGFTYNNIGQMVEMGVDGSDIYLKGLVSQHPESWVKGTVNGDKATFASAQYVGPDPTYGSFAYFAGAELNPETGELTYLESFDLDYDAENMTLTAPEEIVLLYNLSADGVNFVSAYQDAMVRPQPATIDINLRNITNLIYDDSWLPYFQFNYSTLNHDGYLLDTDHLYYKMFVDDEEYTFYGDDYLYIDEMTWVPVTFSDDYDVINNAGDAMVYIYFEGFDTVGFQLYYVDGDVESGDYEVIAESDMALYTATGVKEVGAVEGKTIASAKYYDMSGKEVRNASNGIFVKTVKYTDGTRKSFKVVKK